MSSRNRQTRIEPSFGSPDEDYGVSSFFVSEDDRVMPARKKSAAPKRRAPAGQGKASSRKASQSRRRGKATRQRRGVVGCLRRAPYW